MCAPTACGGGGADDAEMNEWQPRQQMCMRPHTNSMHRSSTFCRAAAHDDAAHDMPQTTNRHVPAGSEVRKQARQAHQLCSACAQAYEAQPNAHQIGHAMSVLSSSPCLVRLASCTPVMGACHNAGLQLTACSPCADSAVPGQNQDACARVVSIIICCSCQLSSSVIGWCHAGS